MSLFHHTHRRNGNIDMSTTDSTKRSTIAAEPIAVSYSDTWTCCDCGANNIDGTAPDCCPLCGHYRQGCC